MLFVAAEAREFRGLLPLDSRQVLDAFRRGMLPEQSGIVIV